MLTIKSKNIQKQIRCPKCGTPTKVVGLNKMRVNQCQIGCGIWINQAEVDANRKARSEPRPVVAQPSIGILRSRRYSRR